MGVSRISRFSGAAPRSRAEVLWTERTNFGEVFSRRPPDPVRDVRRREQQNDVLWARQETSWLSKTESVAAKCSPRAPRVMAERPNEVPEKFQNPQRRRRRSRVMTQIPRNAQE